MTISPIISDKVDSGGSKNVDCELGRSKKEELEKDGNSKLTKGETSENSNGLIKESVPPPCNDDHSASGRQETSACPAAFSYIEIHRQLEGPTAESEKNYLVQSSKNIIFRG